MGNVFLSAHLYYSDHLNQFLEEGIVPFLNKAQQSNLLDGFFFIRYWNRGPHIRLRLKAKNGPSSQDLKSSLNEHFKHFFTNNPSKRIDPNYPSFFPQELKWLPNNSVQYESYQRETDRYGGSKGIHLAEEHFEISSKTALQLVQYFNQNQLEYEHLLYLVLPYHLSFANAIGLEKECLIDFFKTYFSIWKVKCKNVDFEATFQNVKNEIRHNCQLIQDAFDKDLLFDDVILNNWIEQNEDFGETFRKASIEPYQMHPANKYLKENKICEEWNTCQWSMLIDFLHLFNNRLGIHNKDEALIAYLIYRGLEAE